MILHGLFLWLDFAGIFVFAFSGGMTAARKDLDPFGAVIIGAVTGMGGGTLRDILLGETPVYWVQTPAYLGVAAAGALVGYFLSAFIIGRRMSALVWSDAVGLGVFAMIGAQAGLNAEAHWSIAILTGVMSAAFGGLVRDVIVNDVPLVLREEVYALAALAGAGSYVLALHLGAPADYAALAAALIGFGVRACAIKYKWSLPPISRFRPPGQ